MAFEDFNGQRYIVYSDEAPLIALGFERHDVNSYFKKPGATALGLPDASNKAKKTADSMYHFHLITIVTPTGKLGLDSIKVKCGSQMGWWMIRKDTGTFRLSGNESKYGKKGTIQPNSISPQKNKYDYGRVTAMLAFLPAEWLHAKYLTTSATNLLV